jgi:hypothetical protein
MTVFKRYSYIYIYIYIYRDGHQGRSHWVVWDAGYHVFLNSFKNIIIII